MAKQKPYTRRQLRQLRGPQIEAARRRARAQKLKRKSNPGTAEGHPYIGRGRG